MMKLIFSQFQIVIDELETMADLEIYEEVVETGMEMYSHGQKFMTTHFYAHFHVFS